MCREKRAEGNYMYGQAGAWRRRQDGQTCGAALFVWPIAGEVT
jgi:hypothetical protein